MSAAVAKHRSAADRRAARDRKIVAAHQAGATLKAIAKKHRLSFGRVGQIVRDALGPDRRRRTNPRGSFVGRRYGLFTVVAVDPSESVATFKSAWVVRCDCGRVEIHPLMRLYQKTRDGRSPRCSACLVSVAPTAERKRGKREPRYKPLPWE